jgi:hypothetical protein
MYPTARVKDNLPVKGTSIRIGRGVFYRTRKNKTFSGKYPDMTGIIPSKNQARGRRRFVAGAHSGCTAGSLFMEPQLRATEFISEHKKRSNGLCRRMNEVSRPAATPHLREPAGMDMVKANAGKAAGACFLIGSCFGE